MVTQNGFGLIGMLIAVATIIIAGAVWYLFPWQMDLKEDGGDEFTACSQEAMICPDGSAVTRTGPNCEFAECAKPSIAQNDVSTWKTYRNEEYGFEFKYPEDVSVDFGEVSVYGSDDVDYSMVLNDKKGELGSINIIRERRETKNLSFDTDLGKYIYEDTGAIATQEPERNDWFVDDSGVTITTVNCIQPLPSNSEILAIHSYYPSQNIQIVRTVSFILFTGDETKIQIASPWLWRDYPPSEVDARVIIQDYINRISPILKTFKFVGGVQQRSDILCRWKERG